MVLQRKRVCVYLSLCVCLVEQAVMDVGYIKHHNQSLISHLLYNVINNFAGRHTIETMANASTHIDGDLLPCLIMSATMCAQTFSRVLRCNSSGFTDVVSSLTADGN